MKIELDLDVYLMRNGDAIEACVYLHEMQDEPFVISTPFKEIVDKEFEMHEIPGRNLLSQDGYDQLTEMVKILRSNADYIEQRLATYTLQKEKKDGKRR